MVGWWVRNGNLDESVVVLYNLARDINVFCCMAYDIMVTGIYKQFNEV